MTKPAFFLVLSLALTAATTPPRSCAQNSSSPQKDENSQSGTSKNVAEDADEHEGFDYRTTVLADLQDTGQRLIDLARAMPPDKYKWRPSGEASLSVSELYLLAATEYYHLPSTFGAIQAAGYEYGGDAVTGQRQATEPLEKSTTDKSQVVTEIVDAVSYFKGIMPTVTDADLQKRVKVAGRETTPNEALLVLANDMHEYLAQAMDYARQNGVVLPWMAELQKQKQKRGERTPFR